eukprot:COSAG02_NODE_1933_length_10319_cov_22.624168_14_plen_100_part_00
MQSHRHRWHALFDAGAARESICALRVARSRVDGDDARAAVYGQVRRHSHRQTQMVVKAVDAVDEEEMEQARQRADRVVRQRYATRAPWWTQINCSPEVH